MGQVTTESKDPFLREQQLLQKARDEAYARGFKEGLEVKQKSVTCFVPTTDLPDSKLDELAVAARKATPGPWHSSPHCVWAGEIEPGPFGGHGFICQTYNDAPIGTAEIANAKHIAAADPTTLLALVEELRRRRNEHSAIPAEPVKEN